MSDTERAYEQVRVAYHPVFSDGLRWARFVDGTTVNTLFRYQAERLVTLLGPPARIVEIAEQPAAPELSTQAGDVQPTLAPAEVSTSPASAGGPPRRRR